MPKEENKTDQKKILPELPREGRVQKEFDIDLSSLKTYMSKKCYGLPFDLKNFATPLDLGKYKLAEMLYHKLKSVKELSTQIRVLFIAHKLNEFLEDPTIYAGLSVPVKTNLSNRKDFSEFVSSSDIFGVEICAEVEIDRLFDLLKTMHDTVSSPIELSPVYTKSSNFFWQNESQFYKVIKSLYDQCQYFNNQKLTNTKT